MVSGFTANEIGDVLLAKLKDPYLEALRITNWEILAGLSTSNTVGTLAFTQDSTTVVGTGTNLDLQSGDTFIVGNLTYTVDQVIDTNTFTITAPATFTLDGLSFYKPLNQNNAFVYEYRWAQGNGGAPGEMSEFKPLTLNSDPGDLLALTFNPSLKLWLDVRATVDLLGIGNSLSIISITYEIETEAGVIEACPQFCGECDDPWAFVGCENVLVTCEEDNTFNPYELKRPTNLYKQITDVSTSIWGHEVQYFRVEPDDRSRDVILMEYSLYNVVEEGTLKVMVPDNQFPGQEFTFDIFGMGFEEFEIHVTGTEFNKAFGIGTQPRMRDYLYFPVNNKMYEVSSVSFADEFNLTMTYWRVKLRKYEDRTSSVHTDTAIEQSVDDLISGVDEIFGEEIQQEYDKVTKPDQYQTVFHIVQDGTREAIHQQLTIKDVDLRNRWTVISRNYYDFTSISNPGEDAVIYNVKSSLNADANASYVGWFRPTLNTTFASTQQDLFHGYNNGAGISLSTSRTEMVLTINSQIFNMDLLAIDNAENPFFEATDEDWFAYVVNVSNTFSEVGVYIYKLDGSSNTGLPQAASNRLDKVFSSVNSIAAETQWNTNTQYSLRSGYMHMTNIRVFTKTIGEEQHANVLQQYVVRDSDLSILIDNAIPSLMLRKYGTSR